MKLDQRKIDEIQKEIIETLRMYEKPMSIKGLEMKYYCDAVDEEIDQRHFGEAFRCLLEYGYIEPAYDLSKVQLAENA